MVASLIVDHKILQLRLLCLGPMQLKARLFDSCEVHVDIECADMIQQVFVVLTQILLAQIMVALEGLALVDLQDVARVGSLMPLLLMVSLDTLLARKFKIALLLAALRLLIIFHLLLLLGCNFFGELHSLETGFFNLERAVRWLPLHQNQGFLLVSRRLLLLDLGGWPHQLSTHRDFIALMLDKIYALHKLLLSINSKHQRKCITFLLPFVVVIVIAVECFDVCQSLYIRHMHAFFDHGLAQLAFDDRNFWSRNLLNLFVL